MKQLKIYLPAMLLLLSTHAFSQIKEPPPPPPSPEVKNPPPPPPPEIKGHAWTRNGKDVWVVKPHKPTKPVIPPPPPPLPPNNEQ